MYCICDKKYILLCVPHSYYPHDVSGQINIQKRNPAMRLQLQVTPMAANPHTATRGKPAQRIRMKTDLPVLSAATLQHLQTSADSHAGSGAESDGIVNLLITHVCLNNMPGAPSCQHGYYSVQQLHYPDTSAY